MAKQLVECCASQPRTHLRLWDLWNNMSNTQNIQVTFSSVRVSHGIAAYGNGVGILPAHQTDWCKYIRSTARAMIIADAAKEARWQDNAGRAQRKTIEDKAPRSKVSGSGERTKLTVGGSESWYIGESIGADLLRNDQAFTSLEKLGCAPEWVPVVGGSMASWLNRMALQFKASRTTDYPVPAPVPAPEPTKTAEPVSA